MIEAVLKMSNSRALLVGAVFADTVCLGVLALMVTMPFADLTKAGSLVFLMSLAMTVPILALIVGCFVFALSSSKHDEEEKARRALLVATVLHFGIQLSTLLKRLSGCDCGPASPGDFVRSTLLLAIVMTVSLVIIIRVMWWVQKKREQKYNGGGSQPKSTEESVGQPMSPVAKLSSPQE